MHYRKDAQAFKNGINITKCGEKLHGICLVFPIGITLFKNIKYYVKNCGYGCVYSTKDTVVLTKGRQLFSLRIGFKRIYFANNWKFTFELVRLPFGAQEEVIARVAKEIYLTL